MSDQELDRCTESIRELLSSNQAAQQDLATFRQTSRAGQWQNSIQIGRELNDMVARELYKENPEVMAYAAKAKHPSQRPGPLALALRHLKTREIKLTQPRSIQVSRAATFVDQAGAITAVIPSHESVIRPLLGLKEKGKPLPIEQLAEIWNEAVATADGQEPTAKQVKTVIAGCFPKPEPRKRKPRESTDKRPLIEVLAEYSDGEIMNAFSQYRHQHDKIYA